MKNAIWIVRAIACAVLLLPLWLVASALVGKDIFKWAGEQE